VRHPDAAWGDTVPHIRQVAVRIEGERVVVDAQVYFRGRASGAANNCLIDTLRQKLDIVGVSSAWVRARLRERFPSGAGEVTANNFLTLDIHWSSIIEFLGQGAMEVGLRQRPLQASIFKIVCVDLESFGELIHGDVVGNGPMILMIARTGHNHFIPLIRQWGLIGGGSSASESKVIAPDSLREGPPQSNTGAAQTGHTGAAQAQASELLEEMDDASAHSQICRDVVPEHERADQNRTRVEQERAAQEARARREEISAMAAVDEESRAYNAWLTLEQTAAEEVKAPDLLMDPFDALLEEHRRWREMELAEELAEQQKSSGDERADGQEALGDADDALRREQERCIAEEERLQWEEEQREEALGGQQDLHPGPRTDRAHNDMLARLCVFPQRLRKHAFEERLDGAARLAVSHLRRRVTLPPELETRQDLQGVLDTALRLPIVSCAFRGCTYREECGGGNTESLNQWADSPCDRRLREHVLNKHGRLIQDVAQVAEEWIWDVYKQALAVQERQTVPAVGAAIDRRAFEHTLQRYNDDSIRALICFACARVCLDTGGPRSHIEFKEGGWFLALPVGSVQKNFSKDEFERRYQQHGSPLAHRGSGQCNPDFSDWLLNWHPEAIAEASTRRSSGAVFNQDVLDMAACPLLCCPEDQRCHRGCIAKKLFCQHCQVPVCRDCQLALQVTEHGK